MFGWSLPPACGTLPGEESGAYEQQINGVWYAWDEDDRVYVQDPKNPEAMDDGYVYIGNLAWPNAPDADPVKVLREFVGFRWETFCKRTEDPKLSYIERMLDARGIPHRRNGESWHAPILEVPEQHLAAAWEMLGEDVDGRRLDDIPDDDLMFV